MGIRLGVCEIGARLIDSDLIVTRINFDQYSPLLHVFVVFGVDSNDITADTRTDRIKMRVHLCVIGGFIAGEVAPQKRSTYTEYKKGQEEKGKPLYVDLRIDMVLQRGIRGACRLASIDPKTVKEYTLFAKAPQATDK